MNVMDFFGFDDNFILNPIIPDPETRTHPAGFEDRAVFHETEDDRGDWENDEEKWKDK